MGYYLVGATDLTNTFPAGVSIGTDTVPFTLAEVASVIFEVESELNAAAAQAGYAVPIATGATHAYALMQLKTRQGAAAHVLGVIFPAQGGPGTRAPLVGEYRKAYEDFVKALREGKTPLIDAGSSGAGGSRELPRSFETSESISPSPMVPLGWRP